MCHYTSAGPSTNSNSGSDIKNTILVLKTEIIKAIDDKLDESTIDTKIHKNSLYVPLTEIYDIINMVKL